jgi:hypothetical protein
VPPGFRFPGPDGLCRIAGQCGSPMRPCRWDPSARRDRSHPVVHRAGVSRWLVLPSSSADSPDLRLGSALDTRSALDAVPRTIAIRSRKVGSMRFRGQLIGRLRFARGGPPPPIAVRSDMNLFAPGRCGSRPTLPYALIKQPYSEPAAVFFLEERRMPEPGPPVPASIDPGCVPVIASACSPAAVRGSCASMAASAPGSSPAALAGSACRGVALRPCWRPAAVPC